MYIYIYITIDYTHCSYNVHTHTYYYTYGGSSRSSSSSTTTTTIRTIMINSLLVLLPCMRRFAPPAERKDELRGRTTTYYNMMQYTIPYFNTLFQSMHKPM